MSYKLAFSLCRLWIARPEKLRLHNQDPKKKMIIIIMYINIIMHFIYSIHTHVYDFILYTIIMTIIIGLNGTIFINPNVYNLLTRIFIIYYSIIVYNFKLFRFNNVPASKTVCSTKIIVMCKYEISQCFNQISQFHISKK